MKKWIAFLLALACLLSLCACNAEEDANEEKKEKYVTVYLPAERVYEDGEILTYTYDDDGNLTSSVRTVDGEETYRYEYTYDEDGNRIEYVRYEDGEETYRSEYTYDEDGNVIESVDYEYGEEYTRYTYAYDKDGNQTERVVYRYGEEYYRYTYTYNNEGKVTESYYYSDGEETGYETYTYDEEENTVTQYYYYKYGTKYELSSIYITTYDDQDRILQRASYDADDEDRLDKAEPTYLYTYVYEGDNIVEYARYYNGELDSHETRKYNEQGDVIKQISTYYYNGHKDSSYTYEYEYTYDDEDNIIEQKSYVDGEYSESSSWTCTYIAVRMTRKRAKELGYI